MIWVSAYQDLPPMEKRVAVIVNIGAIIQELKLSIGRRKKDDINPGRMGEKLHNRRGAEFKG